MNRLTVLTESPRNIAERNALAAYHRGDDQADLDREATDAEREFWCAIQEYKQSSGRMFPTWSEVLEVVKGLGYQKADG